MKAARLFHLLAVLTAALLLPGQMAGKVVMNFYEIVTDGTKVSAEFDDGGVVNGPSALMERIGITYTLTSTNTTALKYKRIGLIAFDVASSNSNKLTIGGLSEGDQVVIVLSASQAGRLTTAGTKTCKVNGADDNWTEVAKSASGTVTQQTITAMGSTVTVIDKGGWTVIERIEITPAQEASESEMIAAPVITNDGTTVTITPGEVTNKKDGSSITTYYTTDGTTPSATNGTAGTTLTISQATVVKAITVSTSGAESDVTTAIVSPTAARAATLDLTTINTGSDVALTSTGIKATNYYYATEYIGRLYGTLAFNSPTRWTIGANGLRSTSTNDYFEIPNLKEGDEVQVSISAGRLQLYGQATSTHLVDGKTPSDAYANISKAGDEG